MSVSNVINCRQIKKKKLIFSNDVILKLKRTDTRIHTTRRVNARCMKYEKHQNNLNIDCLFSQFFVVKRTCAKWIFTISSNIANQRIQMCTHTEIEKSMMKKRLAHSSLTQTSAIVWDKESRKKHVALYSVANNSKKKFANIFVRCIFLKFFVSRVFNTLDFMHKINYDNFA